MTYVVMDHVVMACTDIAYIGMAYIVVQDIVMDPLVTRQHLLVFPLPCRFLQILGCGPGS